MPSPKYKGVANFLPSHIGIGINMYHLRVPIAMIKYIITPLLFLAAVNTAHASHQHREKPSDEHHRKRLKAVADKYGIGVREMGLGNNESPVIK